ncbi:SDR family oxidoreductase [Ulvibacterium sp.]|uniref:SDR family NAD(P)-dependent oxidoreductase n=1 Tax=Ulvibacterium sp. TaxID=2665914 RepID=UPI002601CA0A|nr:SDR family oxidoreductase [Ulvibacterium sp.]
MEKRFKDKVIVVTGGSKGMGKAVCELFHNEGAKVAALDVDEKAGNEFRTGFRTNFLFKKCDVSDNRQVTECFKDVIKAFGEINYLVNNAGVLGYTDAVTTTEAEWDRVMDINLKSAWLCARQAIPSMQRIGKGCIVNVASVNSFHCQKNTMPYATSKAALLGLTRSIAVDFKPQIRCVAICPGTVDTPMLHEALDSFEHPDKVMGELNDIHLTGRIGQAAEIAELVAYLCGESGSFITGQAIRIDGGLGIELGGVE